jgi:hypothetical protein
LINEINGDKHKQIVHKIDEAGIDADSEVGDVEMTETDYETKLQVNEWKAMKSDE